MALLMWYLETPEVWADILDIGFGIEGKSLSDEWKSA